MSKLPEEIWNKMKSWLNERVPEPSSNDAPYYTTGDKYDDLEEALKFAYSLAISQPIEGRIMEEIRTELEGDYHALQNQADRGLYSKEKLKGYKDALWDLSISIKNKLISHPAQQEGQGMKWVKASERLPEGTVFARRDFNGVKGWFMGTLKMFDNGATFHNQYQDQVVYKFSNSELYMIEWLDESPASIHETKNEPTEQDEEMIPISEYNRAINEISLLQLRLENAEEYISDLQSGRR